MTKLFKTCFIYGVLWMFGGVLLLSAPACAAGSHSRARHDTQIGVAHMKRGHSSLAEARFRKVLEEDPKNAVAHYELGRMEALRGNAEQARQHFEVVVTKQAYNASAHVNLGWALLELNAPSSAAEHFRKAIELEDEEASAHTGLGAVLLARHQPNRAKKEFDRTLKIDPNNPLAHYYLGEFFGDKGDLTRAVQHYRQCAGQDNRLRSASYYKLACCLADLKKDSAALNALQQAARFGFRDSDRVLKDARFKKQRPQIEEMFREFQRSAGGDWQ